MTMLWKDSAICEYAEIPSLEHTDSGLESPQDGPMNVCPWLTQPDGSVVPQEQTSLQCN